MNKSIPLAALLCLGVSHIALAQGVPGWLSKLKFPSAPVVTADVISAYFANKADVEKGTLTDATLNKALLFAATLDATSTAPTQPAGSNNQTIANTNYVDGAIQTAEQVAVSQALAGDTIKCPALTVGAALAVSFAATGNACYNLLLTQANPALTINAPSLTGSGQSITLIVTQPATPVAWSAPTSTSVNVHVAPNFVPTAVAGSTQIFSAMSAGDGNVFLNNGSTYLSGTALAYASNLSVDTPPQTTPGTAFTLTGYESGGTSTAFDYSTDGGTTWTLISSPTIVNGLISVPVPGLSAGSYTLALRDHNNPTIATATTGTFVVSPWTPNTLSVSPNAYAVYATDPNNPSLASADGSGNLLNLASSLNQSQYLLPASGATGNKVQVARATGADGKHRLVKFHAAQTNAGAGDPNANWLTAGNLITSGGYAGSGLLTLANSANNATSGSYTVIIGEDFDTSAASAIAYESGFIWGTLAKPGPLSYVQNRWNPTASNFSVQIADVAGGFTSATSPVKSGYHVITMIKNLGVITYRMDGVQVSSQPILATGATAFDGTYGDFMLGGSVNAGQAAENGTPPPYLGDFQAYSGVLQGTDLANAEMMVASSMGETISPVVPTPVGVATQIAVSTIPSTTSGTPISVSYSYVGNLQGATYSINGGTAVPTGTTPSGGTGTFSIAGGLTAGAYTIKVCDVNSTVCGTSASFNIVQSVTYASAFSVTAPSGVVPGSAFPVTASFTAGTGSPQAVDYQILSGGVGQGWVQVASPTITTSPNTVKFTTVAGLGAGSYSIQVRDRNNVASASTAVPFSVVAPTVISSATAITCPAAPPVSVPGAAVSFSCTYTGTPVSFDYQLTAGTSPLGWGTPSNVVITPNSGTTTAGTLTFVMPAGNADIAGLNTVQIRDHNAPSVVSAAIPVYTETWTPQTLATSPGASAVWQVDAANTASVGSGNVSQVFNVLNPARYLGSVMGSGNVPVVGVSGSGSDGLHRAIAFSPTKSTSYTSGDPKANWLSAAAGSAPSLLTLANSTKLSTTGAFTIVEAAKLDTTDAFTNFFAFGQSASPGPLQYLQLRHNPGSGALGPALDDASQTFVQTGGSAVSGWHVFTIIKTAAGALTYREDGVPLGTTTITSTSSLTATDFTIGGSFAGIGSTVAGGEFGTPPPYVSGMLAFSGVLAGADLDNAENMEAASFGGKTTQ